MYYLIGCFVCFVFGPQFGLGPPRAPPLDLPLIVMLENVFYTGELIWKESLEGCVLVMYTEGKCRKRNDIFVL